MAQLGLPPALRGIRPVKLVYDVRTDTLDTHTARCIRMRCERKAALATDRLIQGFESAHVTLVQGAEQLPIPFVLDIDRNTRSQCAGARRRGFDIDRPIAVDKRTRNEATDK